jgi:putative transposase
MPYSLDLREKVIGFLERGHGITETAKLFRINRATIYRWLARPSLAQTRVTTRKRKVDVHKLQQDVEQNPDMPLKERAQRFGVTPAALCYRLKQLRITRKKTASLSRTRS